jgi:hypothetical protein
MRGAAPTKVAKKPATRGHDACAQCKAGSSVSKLAEQNGQKAHWRLERPSSSGMEPCRWQCGGAAIVEPTLAAALEGMINPLNADCTTRAKISSAARKLPDFITKSLQGRRSLNMKKPRIQIRAGVACRSLR